MNGVSDYPQGEIIDCRGCEGPLKGTTGRRSGLRVMDNPIDRECKASRPPKGAGPKYGLSTPPNFPVWDHVKIGIL